MEHRTPIIILSLLFLLLAAGCTKECAIEDYDAFFPVLISPANGAEVDYQTHPLLDWKNEESCQPRYYILHIERGDGKSGMVTVPGDKTLYSMPADLIPGMSYTWYVEPYGDFIGDGSGDVNVQHIYGPRSPIWTFTADGICTPGELVPPVLEKPQDGAWISNNYDTQSTYAYLKWSYPGDCYPESFHYQLASDPDFHHLITSGITTWDHRSIHVALPECARVYWRVEARTGYASGGYSETSRFTYALDYSCWQNQASIDAALIRGFVYEDICPSTVPYVPEAVEIFPPCTFGEPYGVHADGNRSRTESGLSSVMVDLGAGPCPSTGLDKYKTDANGMFFFMVQSPGVYCISVDKDNETSTKNLLYGIWTQPLTNSSVAEVTVNLEPGDLMFRQNIGWDENDYLQIPFKVKLRSFCRSGDTPEHAAVAVVDEGMTLPVFARNEDATWFATFVNGQPCFISLASGTPDGDPDDLIIYPRQPEAEIVEPAAPPKSCTEYLLQGPCEANGCKWQTLTGAGGHCVNK